MTTSTPEEPATTDRPFRIEVTIAAPADAVWSAIRDRDQVLRWHGWEVDGLEAEVDMIFFTDTVESPDQRSVVVNGGDRFDVIEQGDGSLLRMTRAPRDPANHWDKWYDDINEGWTTFLHQLRFALERHPGEHRRTIYLEGTLGSEDEPITALGLSESADGPLGAPYAADLVGEQVSGALHFRAARQAGFSVEQWGDGLAVLGVAAPSDVRPHGGVMAVLTTYGLSDERRDDLERRWTAWWQARYPKADSPAEEPVQ